MCLKKIVSLWLAALLMLTLFSACGGETSASGAGHSFSYTLVGNPDTLDPQLAVNDSAKTVLCNLFEGLLTLDENGSVVNGVAESTVRSGRLRASLRRMPLPSLRWILCLPFSGCSIRFISRLTVRRSPAFRMQVRFSAGNRILL